MAFDAALHQENGPITYFSLMMEDISTDFEKILPKVEGNSIILTVVDRVSKHTHSIPLAYPYSATTVPQQLLSEFFRFSGIDLHKSSAYHLRFNGQSEIVNKIMVMYSPYLYGG